MYDSHQLAIRYSSNKDPLYCRQSLRDFFHQRSFFCPIMIWQACISIHFQNRSFRTTFWYWESLKFGGKPFICNSFCYENSIEYSSTTLEGQLLGRKTKTVLCLSLTAPIRQRECLVGRIERQSTTFISRNYHHHKQIKHSDRMTCSLVVIWLAPWQLVQGFPVQMKCH